MTVPADDLESQKRPTRSRKRSPSTTPEEHPAAEYQVASEPAPDEEMSEEQPAEASQTQTERTMARADVLLDQTGQRVGQFFSDLGHRLHVASARAREEAEDVWAEAKSVRDKERQ